MWVDTDVIHMMKPSPSVSPRDQKLDGGETWKQGYTTTTFTTTTI